MARPFPKLSDMVLSILVLGLLNAGGFGQRAAVAQYTAPSTSPSWTESVSSSFKQGFDKIGSTFSPSKSSATIPTDGDASSLAGKGKPDPNLYTQMARLYESSNKYSDAEEQYRMALALNPNYLPALLGYAQLKDRTGKPDDAIRIYQCAVKAYPQDAAVQNNMGLCHARARHLDEAAIALGRAVQLEPKNTLYRNNLATVLVDQGRFDEAFEQLSAAHDAATSHYNMGYLLNKKGDVQEAMAHFTAALQSDPSMAPARRWVEYLQPKVAQTHVPKPMSGNVRVITPSPSLPPEPAAAVVQSSKTQLTRLQAKSLQETAPMPPAASVPKHLPPTNSSEPTAVLDGPSLSGLSYGPTTTALVTPLPPVTASRPIVNPSVQSR